MMMEGSGSARPQNLRIRILFLMKVMGVCDHWSTGLLVLHFEHQASIVILVRNTFV
jgi:hypothetical protein